MYFNYSRSRSVAEAGNWPLVLRRVYNQLGHHPGCAEIGCIVDALNAGETIKGSRSLAMLHKPFEHLRNRELIPACGQCRSITDRLGITDTFNGR